MNEKEPNLPQNERRRPRRTGIPARNLPQSAGYLAAYLLNGLAGGRKV